MIFIHPSTTTSTLSSLEMSNKDKTIKFVKSNIWKSSHIQNTYQIYMKINICSEKKAKGRFDSRSGKKDKNNLSNRS